MPQTTFYNVSFPFTTKDENGYFVDLDTQMEESIKSDLLHLLMTPKGQKIRDPEFGTDLIKYIFSPNDQESWDDVKTEIQQSVARNLNNVKLNDIEVYQEDQHGLMARISYSVNHGSYTTNTTITTPI